MRDDSETVKEGWDEKERTRERTRENESERE